MDYPHGIENQPSALAFPLKRRRPDKLIQLTRDGYKWRKYGRKTLMDKTCVRSYYKCTHSQTKCPAKKFVDLNDNDYDRIKVSYLSQHNHPLVSKVNHATTPESKISLDGRVHIETLMSCDSEFSSSSSRNGERNPESQLSTSDEKDASNNRTLDPFPVADSWTTTAPDEPAGAGAGAFRANYCGTPTDGDPTAPTWMTDVTSSNLCADSGLAFGRPFPTTSSSTAAGSDPFSLLGGRNTLSLADFMFPSRTPDD